MPISTNHLDKLALSRLLNLSHQSRWSIEDGICALRHQLAAPLLPDLGATADVNTQELEYFLKSYPGPVCFGTQLTTPTPSLYLLSAIKRFSKCVSEDPDNPLFLNGGRVLYFAAIAAALVHGRQRLSSLDDAQLHNGFDWAKEQPGAETLRPLFDESLRVLDHPTTD